MERYECDYCHETFYGSGVPVLHRRTNEPCAGRFCMPECALAYLVYYGIPLHINADARIAAIRSEIERHVARGVWGLRLPQSVKPAPRPDLLRGRARAVWAPSLWAEYGVECAVARAQLVRASAPMTAIKKERKGKKQ